MAAAAAFAATPAFAQSAWPDRNIRMIVPYPAGGSTDVLFRILAERLKDKLNQTIVVENRAGASGNTGIDAVAKSAADGYTIGGAVARSDHLAVDRGDEWASGGARVDQPMGERGLQGIAHRECPEEVEYQVHSAGGVQAHVAVRIGVVRQNAAQTRNDQ